MRRRRSCCRHPLTLRCQGRQRSLGRCGRVCVQRVSAGDTQSQRGSGGGPSRSHSPEFRAGYGEVTAGSLQHVLNYLAHLRRHALEAGGEDAAAGVWACTSPPPPLPPAHPP